MSNEIKELISNIRSDDSSKAMDSFEQIFSSKIEGAIDAKRAEIASSILGGSVEAND